MKYHVTSAVLILTAIVLETAGFSGVGSALGVILLGAGVVLELWFWVRLFRTRAARIGS